MSVPPAIGGGASGFTLLEVLVATAIMGLTVAGILGALAGGITCLSFGQPLYLSQLYAAIMAVEGVDSATVTQFHRWGKLPANELQQGYIATDRLEILRLDNDPNFPENGALRLNIGGGK